MHEFLLPKVKTWLSYPNLTQSGGFAVLNLHKHIIEHFVDLLLEGYIQTYSIRQPDYGNIISWAGQLALENIANTDALYHNLEHTLMVATVGQTILRGKHLCDGGVTPNDWLHFMLAVLFHDIGYVRGVCQNDKDGRYATGIGDSTVELPEGATDVALTPYHVDRSKQFVCERFGGALLVDVDEEVIASYIEMTRFPTPNYEVPNDPKGYGPLVRAADFIGQLGDPEYLRKIPALYYEFEQTGTNAKMGYTNPGDMRKSYARFFWNVVNPHIADAIRYLKVTQDGKSWVSNLYAHVFSVEHHNY